MDEPELVVTLRYHPASKTNDFEFGGKLAELLGPATQQFIAQAILTAVANVCRQHAIIEGN